MEIPLYCIGRIHAVDIYISVSSRVCKQMFTIFDLSHDMQRDLVRKLYMKTKCLLAHAQANVASIAVYNVNIADIIETPTSASTWGIVNHADHHKSINYHEFIDMTNYYPFTSHFDVITHCVAEMEQRTEAAKNHFDMVASVDISSLSDTRAWNTYNDDLDSARLIYSQCKTELNSWKWAAKCINIQTIQEAHERVLNLNNLCARYHIQLLKIKFTQEEIAGMVYDEYV